MKIYKIVLMVIVLCGIAYLGGAILSSKTEYKIQEKEVILDNLTEKINELKGKLVSDLKSCESGGYVESDGLVTFDPHPTKKSVQIASFGLYQFKVSTVQYYYNKFYGKQVNGLEAINIALSEEKSSELASEVIFRDGALGNWFNCSKKLGLQQKLDIIKELEK
jgi:hypothetical protein